MGRAYSQNGKKYECFQNFKRTEKTDLKRPRHRWEDNTRMDLKEIGVNMKN